MSDAPGHRSAPESRELPLFPLGVVQFPTMPLDLQIFEPRYLALLNDLGSTGLREFGIVAIRSGHEVGSDNLHRIAEAGCAVRIVNVRPTASRMLVQARGTWRFDSIEIIDSSKPYAMARVRPLPDDPAPADHDVDRLRSALLAYASAAQIELRTVPAEPDELVWWAAAGGPLTLDEQLAILQAPEQERIDLLARCLRREASLLLNTGSVPFRPDRRAQSN